VISLEVSERDGSYRVVVRDLDGATEHDVVVPEQYVDALGLADVPRSVLIEHSFRFLLEREPKEAIMRRFDLPVIERYFSEYPDEIARRLKSD
jgi:hypothetical protein